MTKPTLQIDFPDYTRSDWRALAEKGLRGADFDTLESLTEDGLVRGPLFDQAKRPDQTTALPKPDSPLLEGRSWHICAPVLDSDIAYANEQLLSDLKGGASAVRIMAGRFERKADLKRLLEGVFLNLVPIVFAPRLASARMALDLDELYATPITLGLDPLGDLPDTPELWRAFTIDAASLHEEGCTDMLELAGFAAIAAESLRRHGPSAHKEMSAVLSVGTDAHLNIVKIRAARRLYATIAGHFGIARPSIPIHALTSLRMMQSQDAWTNLLRTMSAGFGAVAGGADYLTVRPFTETPETRRLGEATPFGHRIARNQQILMMEESHLGQVQDAASGSYFHERLTEDLAQAAWSKFQQIEAVGGIAQYQASGAYEQDLEAVRANREARNAPILGVTLHPSESVKAPEVRS